MDGARGSRTKRGLIGRNGQPKWCSIIGYLCRPQLVHNYDRVGTRTPSDKGRYQLMAVERSRPFCRAADMEGCWILKALHESGLLWVTRARSSIHHSGTEPLEWMVVEGPSFVSTEVLFYSRKGSLINLYIVKMRAYAPCLCTKVTAILY